MSRAEPNPGEDPRSGPLPPVRDDASPEEEMEEDGFVIFDVENALLTGRIVGRQTDRRSRERKYLILGRSADGATDLVVVVKFGPSDELVILTVYAD